VLGLEMHPDSGEFVGDEWVPLAEHPERSIWIVGRA
jgi:hypothetical protein